jgi:hypothetical protein
MFFSKAYDEHCSLGSRSFTDPISNWTLISGVNLNRDLSEMIQAGKYPSKYLPEFVHELVHHWCFHSPVGIALTLLQLRARRNSALIYAGEADAETDYFTVADDVARYESAVSLMRPLAEGLALFAEYDNLAGESPILSTAMFMTGLSFIDISDEKAPGAVNVAKLNDLLIAERLSDSFRERKANLLVQPFTPENGGYLMGYLTVKNLQNIMSMRCDKFRDSDLFLSYIRSFIYEDYGLVAVLLEPENEISNRGSGDKDCAQAISTYFQKRLAKLLQPISSAEVEQFEQKVLRHGTEAGLTGKSTAVDPSLGARGLQLLDDLVSEISFDGPADTYERKLKRRDLWTVAQRDLMCIGSFPAPVRVNENQRVFVGVYQGDTGDASFPVFNGPALSTAAAGAGDGSAEFFISPSGRYSVLTVTLNGQIVAVFSLSQHIPPELIEQVASYRTGFLEIKKEKELWTNVIDAVLADTATKIYLNHYRNNISEIADALYSKWALASSSFSDLRKCRTLLRQNGLYDILGQNPEVIRALSRLSLMPEWARLKSKVAKFLEEDDIDLDFLLDELKKAHAKCGILFAEEISLSDENDETYIVCYL